MFVRKFKPTTTLEKVTLANYRPDILLIKVEPMEFESYYTYKAGILSKRGSVLWQQNYLPVPSVPGSLTPLQPLNKGKHKREEGN